MTHASGIRSRPRRMARYVFGCRPFRKVHDAPVLDGGPIVCACLVQGPHAMLDLTHPGRLPIPSCTEACRRGCGRLHLDIDQLGRQLDRANGRWFPSVAVDRVLVGWHGTWLDAGHYTRCTMPLSSKVPSCGHVLSTIAMRCSI
jgi:hypothetical protein